MTWRQLLAILQNMERISHTEFDKYIEMDTGDTNLVFVDIVESLTTGKIWLTCAIKGDTDVD